MTILTFDTAVVKTATGNSNPADLANPSHSARNPDPNNLSVILNVSAVSGTTPSLTAEVQWSNDNVTYASAATPDVFTAITANGVVVKSFQVKARFARLVYTITGTTPSFTMTNTGYTA